MKDQFQRVLTMLIFAAIATTLVLPRKGYSPAKAVEGWFQVATSATTSTLGVRGGTVKTPTSVVSPGKGTFQ